MDVLFLDNNVPIGFCFKQDPQHDHANFIFNHNCETNWSNNVEHEFKNVYERKRNLFDDWTFKLTIELKNHKKSLTMFQVLNIAENLDVFGFGREACSKLLKEIWDESNLNNSPYYHEIVDAVRRYKSSFIRDLTKNYAFCIKKLGSPFKRTYTDDNIYKQLKKSLHDYNSEKKLGSDLNICLDAHELGKQKFNLKFITDDNDIVDNKSNIESITKIKHVILLETYYNQIFTT